MSKQIIVKPQGVINEPNKVGQFPPGALQGGGNFAIRSFGLVEQVAKWQDFTTIGGGNWIGGGYILAEGNVVVIIAEQGSLGNWRVVCIYKDPTVLGSPAFYLTVVPAPFSGYLTNDMQTGMILMRNRVIVNGPVRGYASGVSKSWAIDLRVAGGTAVVTAFRDCGVYQAGILDRSFGTTAEADGGVLGPNKHMSASVVMRMVNEDDGYELVSPPSVPYDFANLSSTLTQIPSVWTLRSNISTSSSYFTNKLDVYRTREQSVGYDNVNNKYLPVSTGSSFYVSKTQDRSGATTFVNDSTMPSALGEALLTNTAVSGASALPLPPVPSTTSAVFRGHAFYGNRTDPATINILNPYYWGSMPQTAPVAIRTYGIGSRQFTGGTGAAASPTVTGLSTTIGVKIGQDMVVIRNDTSAQVFNGTVANVSGTSITGSGNIGYTGAVTVTTHDVIIVNTVRIRTGLSAQEFAYNVSNVSTLNAALDITAVGLEPQGTTVGAGVYPGFAPTGGLTIRMRTNELLTLNASNGDNYSPRLPEVGASSEIVAPDDQLNGLAWSENNQPEYCPPSNYAFVGNGEIHKLIATRDCLWIFTSDGLFRLSGNGGSAGDGYDWVIDPVDPKIVIHNPQCAVVHREYVYAFTSRGLVSISSEGVVRELSDGRLNTTNDSSQESARLPNETWTETTANVLNYAAWMGADLENDEIWLVHKLPFQTVRKTWVYNVKTDTFCILRPTYNPTQGSPSLGVYTNQTARFWGIWTGSDQLVASSFAVGGSTRWEQMDLIFQPIFGSGTTAAHTVKHWQDVQISFRTPQTATSIACSLASNTLSGSAISMGSRTIPTVGFGGGEFNVTGETCRVGFTVPRNASALSNTFRMFLTVGEQPSLAVAANPIAVEAISVNYIDFTDQRVDR